MPLIFWGSGGFHQTRIAVEFKAFAFTFVGGDSGTPSLVLIFAPSVNMPTPLLL